MPSVGNVPVISSTPRGHQVLEGGDSIQGSQMSDYLSFEEDEKEEGCMVYFYEENMLSNSILLSLIFGWAILFLFPLTLEISFSNVLQVFLKIEIKRMVKFLYVQTQNTSLTRIEK